MNRPSSLLVAAAVLGALALPAQAQAEEVGRVIVRFKPAAASVRAKIMSAGMTRLEAADVAQTRATALGLRTGRALRARLSLDERTHVIIATGQDSASLARRLAQDSEVELVAVDERRRHYIVPNDPFYATGPAAGPAAGPVVGQWYLKAPTSTVVSSINAPAAWDLTTGSAAVIVAVLDTGVRKDHPDLSAQFVGGYDMIGYGSGSNATSIAVANDGGGPDSDASDPGDWVSQADIDSGSLGSGCDASDIGNSSWHGTRVSGLIGASSNNGLGMAGVGWGIKILPVRVLGKCGGYDSDIMAGMKWAAGLSVPGLPANPNVAKVLNLSLGGTGACGTTGTGALYRDTIGQVTAAGASIVVAAGNSEGEAVGVPGNCPGVIAVTGLRHAGSKVGFSSIGPEVAIAAPGGNCVNPSGACLYPMFSTTNRGTTTPVAADDAYTNGSASVGTSFSTPLVSGTVALMLSLRPSLSPAEVLSLLQKTARPFVSSGATAGIAQCTAPTSSVQDECYCTTSTCGAGMLDAGAAVAAAKAANAETIAITATPASGATAGQTITLTASSSSLAAGRTVVGWTWSLLDGGGAVSGFASATNTASTTLLPTAAGTITVKLTALDDLGVSLSTTSSLSVAAAATVSSSAGTGSAGGGGGGGGGAFSAWFLLLLGLAGLALRRPRPSAAA